MTSDSEQRPIKPVGDPLGGAEALRFTGLANHCVNLPDQSGHSENTRLLYVRQQLALSHLAAKGRMLNPEETGQPRLGNRHVIGYIIQEIN